MTSPFLKLSTQLPAPLGQCHSDDPFPLPTSPCGKGFSPVLTLELRKGYSDHPNHITNSSPKTGKECKDLPHPRDPSSCLTGKSPSAPRRIPTPPPPAPSSLPQSSFEPCSPTLLGRPCCYGPRLPGSSPTSPCLGRLSIPRPPLHPQQSPYCSLASTPKMQRPCPPSSLFDQHPYLYYCSPVASPQLIHIPLETGTIISPLTPESQGTCPVISPPLIHRPLGTGLPVSPLLVHRPMETRPIVSTTVSHRVLETGPVVSSPDSHWSSGRSYDDPAPPAPSLSSRPTDSLYYDHHKPSDSCEPKPQLDVPLGKNCGSVLSSQAGTSGSPSSPQEGSFHYSHISPEAHTSAPGSPYCAIRLPPENTGSSCTPQVQAPKKSCFESLSWGTGGSSYLLLNPGTIISGPPCPPEPPLSHCPYSDFYFPSPLGNQVIAPPQTVPRRSYNEPPLPTPVSPHVKSPKFSEVRQPRTPHKCHSLINTAQHTPSQPKTLTGNTSLPTHQPSGLSPSCIESSITAPSNCCTKELPPGTPLPSMVPGAIKPIFPTSLPLYIPCDPVLPNSYAKSSPQGASLVSPCSTHMYSMVPPTSNPCPPCPPSDSLIRPTRPPQIHNQPIVPPYGTHGAPRGPTLPPCKPPCSTHIYSFIPLRTPFDPQCLPIVPRVRPCTDNMPCGLHTYSVASQVPCKEPPQIPYSCPLPSPKSSTCSSNQSYSSTIVSECQSSDSKSSHLSKSRSRSRSHQSRSLSRSKSSHHSRSRSRSSSPHQVLIQDHSASPQRSRSRKRNKSPHSAKSPGQRKSPHHARSQKQSKSPQNKKK